MKFELWESANENVISQSFIWVEAENYQQNIGLLEPDSRLIWTTEIETYNEVMQKYYDFMNWGKYKPIDE